MLLFLHVMSGFMSELTSQSSKSTIMGDSIHVFMQYIVYIRERLYLAHSAEVSSQIQNKQLILTKRLPLVLFGSVL